MPTPYKAICYVCRNELVIGDRGMDIDGDVIVEVEPCDTCMDAAVEEAKNDGG